VTEKAKQEPRKPYSSPRLVIYGDIAQITQNITNMGTMMDSFLMKT
jgi:hypothetical protein